MTKKNIPKRVKRVEYRMMLNKLLKKAGVSKINQLPIVEAEKILKKLDKEFLDIPISDVAKYINVELTTRCSSKCKFCGRQLDCVKYAIDLPLETLKKLPIEDFKMFRLEGTLGDPIHYPFILDALKEIRRRRNNDTSVLIYTNGNIYNEKWWSKFAKLLDFHPSNKIMFGLDGLKDTHAIHRRGTDFEKITKNIKAFTGAGGSADVQMIVFKHNEHQVEELKELSEKIGCENFYTRVSKKYDDEFERPEMFKQKSRREKTKIVENNGYPVICGMMHTGESFLTVDGLVIPCFKWHSRRSFWKNDDKKTQDMYWKNLPYMNLNDYEFYDILNNDFLKYLKKNLQNMKECGNICRTLNDPYLEKK